MSVYLLNPTIDGLYAFYLAVSIGLAHPILHPAYLKVRVVQIRIPDGFEPLDLSQRILDVGVIELLGDFCLDFFIVILPEGLLDFVDMPMRILLDLGEEPH